MRRFGLSSAVLALLVALAAGCGGGGGGESTATTEAEPARLSRAELVSQGDAICAEVNAAVGAAGSTSSGSGEAIVQVAGLYSGMVERLKGLGPPREEGAGYAGFISSAEELAQAESNVKLAYEREEAEELTAAASEVSTALTRFESAAREFGFEKCAKAPTAPSPSGSGGESGGEESSGGFEAEEAAEAAPEEEVEAAPEEAAPVEEESAGGGAAAGGGAEGGGAAGTGGSSGGIGPG